jgi:hypothetical protein
LLSAFVILTFIFGPFTVSSHVIFTSNAVKIAR